MTGFKIFGVYQDGISCGVGNAHSFRNVCFHFLWGVQDFTHLLYIHYILLHLSVLGLRYLGKFMVQVTLAF